MDVIKEEKKSTFKIKKINASLHKPKKYRPAACTTSPSVAVKDLLFLELPFSGSGNF